jgi:hypothetical protein
MKGKKNWASGIRNILSTCGFYYVWLQQSVGDVRLFLKVFKCRLEDLFKQEWYSTVREKERYSLFRSFQPDFVLANYVLDIDVYCFRVALSHLFFGVLPINSNMHRYSENPDLKMCPFCTDVLENEDHFLFYCPVYSDLRQRFLFDRPTSVIVVLSSSCSLTKLKLLSKYVHYAIQRRNDLHVSS